MTDISDLSCIGPNGKPIYGTAAILHRLFENSGRESRAELKHKAEEQRKLDLEECARIIKENGYYTFSE